VSAQKLPTYIFSLTFGCEFVFSFWSIRLDSTWVTDEAFRSDFVAMQGTNPMPFLFTNLALLEGFHVDLVVLLSFKLCPWNPTENKSDKTS
jgi:hypothetical protein